MSTVDLLNAFVLQATADYVALHRRDIVSEGYTTPRLHMVGRRCSVGRMTRSEIVQLCRSIRSPEFAEVLAAIGVRQTPEEYIREIERRVRREGGKRG